ncbi:hypothetical protein [Aliiroseovarius sp. F20344]|uniref:hypothetical protein n=1 Tax=Aliiroseovarius sp. F20344 TaxID=2926414 RepID=UPI001FF4AFB1|nr:hypothetical protein [Aliiroseovarius sp. F20344]MCK0142426.1 hypothetical protein [Aliiroseovarius sp. F20344]
MFHDGILKDFTPRFKSIRKDCDRYSNELVELFDAEVIDTREYFELNGKGSLWIILQYIERGLLDDVEVKVREDVTSKDFYGPLFDNTVATLAYLTERSEHERVLRLYRAAIEHRLKALKDEAKTRDQQTLSRNTRTTSAKWIRQHLPPARKIVQQYEKLLAINGHSDPELSAFQQSLDAVKSP